MVLLPTRQILLRGTLATRRLAPGPLRPFLIFGQEPPTMSRLEQRKAHVIAQLEATNDEHVVAAVEETLAGNAHYALTREQRRQLDASLERYLRGEAKTHTPEQAKARARKAARG